MSTERRFRRHHAARLTGGAGTIHGGRGDDSRTYADGINMGWAGGSARRRQHAAGVAARRKWC